jgi:hypothetical protein
MWLRERLRIDGPDLAWGRTVKLSHSGDEYGNCSVSLKTALFCIDLFPGPHFQTAVRLPEPGAHPWIDAVRWADVPSQDKEPS